MKQDGVVAIINYNGKILLGKKRSDSKKFVAGKWHVPGETIEFGEDDKTALIRGMREEIGIEIFVGDYIGTNLSKTNKILRWYECFAQTDKVKAGSDLEDIKWIEKCKALKECDSSLVELWSEEIRNYFIS
ncbi:MAG: NUDIX domain-containing protein [Nanoarchaeota archaeon]